jgi:signal recognition particle subunit SRP54
MLEGQFDLDDFLNPLQQIKKMGPLSQLLEMIPGIGGALRQANVQVSDDDYKHIEAIIRSMTPEERRDPDLIRHSRRHRIARGSGVEADDVVGLLKQFREMQRMMAQMGALTGMGPGPKKGKRGVMSRMPGTLGQVGAARDMMKQMQAGGMDMSALGGGLPGMGADPRELERLLTGGQLTPLRGDGGRGTRDAGKRDGQGAPAAQHRQDRPPRSERAGGGNKRPKKKKR